MAKKYKLTGSGVQDIETGAFIPKDYNNRDWRKYQEWINKGNTPDPLETTEEKEAKGKRKKREVEQAIVDAKIKKDAATSEGLTSYASDLDKELTKLRNDLSKL